MLKGVPARYQSGTDRANDTRQREILLLDQVCHHSLINLRFILLEGEVHEQSSTSSVMKKHQSKQRLLFVSVEHLDVPLESTGYIVEPRAHQCLHLRGTPVLVRCGHLVPVHAFSLPFLELELLD